jgi:pyruvate dehydrogenase E1 component alpha subunit
VGLFIPAEYRSSEEVEHWKAERDPVALYRQALLDAGSLDATQVEQLEAAVAQDVAEAVQFALDSEFPQLEEVYDNMYANPINYNPAKM